VRSFSSNSGIFFTFLSFSLSRTVVMEYEKTVTMLVGQYPLFFFFFSQNSG
jgi:hypothetical protein